MRGRAWSTVAASLLVAAPAWAQPVRLGQPTPTPDPDPPPLTERIVMQLDYRGVPGCANPEVFTLALIPRVHGWDPLAPVAPWRLVVTVKRRGWGYEGTSELYDPKGGAPWTRTVSRKAKCFDVLDTLALIVAFYVDPLDLPDVPPPACPAPPAPSPTLPATGAACSDSRFSDVRYSDSRFAIWPTEWPLSPLEKPKPDPPKPPDRAPFAVRLGATVGPELIATGWASFGVSVEAGVRYHAVSIDIEAHGDPKLGSSEIPTVGAVSFERLSGALLLCGHWGLFAGCGVSDVGRFIFPNHVDRLPASAFYGAMGVRANLELPIAPPLAFLRVGVDVRAPINPASYSEASVSIFHAAGPSGGFGLGFVAEIPP